MKPSAYAKHRNVTRGAVYQYLRRGILNGAAKQDANGGWEIDLQKADGILGRVLDVSQKKIGRPPKYIPGQPAVEPTVEGEAPPQDPMDYTVARTRLATEQAEGQALKNAKLRGELVEAEEVRKVWARAILTARSRLLGIRSRVAPIIANMLPDIKSREEILNDIDEVVRECLDELSRTKTDDNPTGE